MNQVQRQQQQLNNKVRNQLIVVEDSDDLDIVSFGLCLGILSWAPLLPIDFKIKLIRLTNRVCVCDLFFCIIRSTPRITTKRTDLHRRACHRPGRPYAARLKPTTISFCPGPFSFPSILVPNIPFSFLSFSLFFPFLTSNVF